MKKILLLILICINFSIFSFEQFLGFKAKDTTKLGTPEQMFVIRGESEPDDDIVFYYGNSVYLYFNNNRVWQVRADKNYTETILEIKIGNSIDEVLTTLGEPFKQFEDSIVYRRPDRGYPVFLRLYFDKNKLNDIYIYRGDY